MTQGKSTTGQERRSVTINGTSYPLAVAGAQQAVDIVPFAAKQSSGDPAYGDFNASSHIEVRDLRGGLGVRFQRPDKPGRFYTGFADTRYPYQVILHPKLNTNTATLKVTAWGESGGTASERICCGVANQIYTVLGTTFTSRLTGTAGTIYDNFIRFANPGETTIKTFAFNTGTNGQYAFADSATPTTWTSVTPTVPTAPIRFAVEFDRKLVGFTDNGIYVAGTLTNLPSTAAVTWNSLVVGLSFIPTSAVPYIDDQGQATILVGGRDSLWRLNYFNAELTLVRDFSGQSSANNCNSMVLHNGAVIIPTVRGILRWSNTQQSYIGPNKGTDDGLDAIFQGDVIGLQSDNEWLWAAWGNDNDRVGHLMVYDDFGWHRLLAIRDHTARTVLNGQIYLFYKTPTGASSTGLCRVWLSYRNTSDATDRAGYFEVPISTDNPLLSGSGGATYYDDFGQGGNAKYNQSYYTTSGAWTYVYESVSEFTTVNYDCGFAEIPKIGLQVNVNYTLPAGSSIEAWYALNNSGTFTQIGTISGSADEALITKTLSFGNPGVAFNQIQFKFVLRVGTSANISPVIRYAVLTYVPRPGTNISRPKQTFRMKLDLTAEALAGFGLTPDTARTALWTARTATTLIAFQDNPPDGTTYYVMMANMPDKRTHNNDQYESEIDVVLVEVI